MHEGNLEAEHAPARLRVDQLGAAAGEIADGGMHVVDLVGDMVHPGPPLREEPPDRRVFPESRQELDPALADADRRRLDPLGLDTLAMLHASAEQALVRRHGLVEVADCDADVVDPACFHAGDRM